MEYSKLSVKKENGTAIVKINNPQSLNALDSTILGELDALFTELENDCSVSAVINKDDAYELSRWLNVPMTHLPGAIGEAVKAQTEVVNPSTREVQECFKAIVDLFVDGKCPYRIIRKYGKHGFIIC